MIKPVILAAAIVPSFIILAYGICKARGSFRSEATWNALVLGAVSAFAAIACEFGLSYFVPFDRTGSTLTAVVNATFAAIPEESIKFFVLLSLAEKQVDVRRVQDILVIALAVSLGFATLENFGFIVTKGNWTITAAARAVTSVPGHGIDGLAMGALLMAARLSGDSGLWRVGNALIIPIALHAAYDFPLFARHSGEALSGAVWLITIAVSSVFVIALCNLLLPTAVEFDRASGRDDESVETTDPLILGGTIGVIGGPLLAAWSAQELGLHGALPVISMSIFPVAFGIDAIRTGLKRRHPNPDKSGGEPTKSSSEIGWV